MYKMLLSAAALLLAFSMSTEVMASCSQKPISLGGQTISVITAEDCNTDKNNRAADQGAVLGLVGDTWLEGDGLTVGLNGGMVDSRGAGSLFLAIKQPVGDGWIDSFSLNVLGAYGADERIGAKLGGSIHFSNLTMW